MQGLLDHPNSPNHLLQRNNSHQGIQARKVKFNSSSSLKYFYFMCVKCFVFMYMYTYTYMYHVLWLFRYLQGLKLQWQTSTMVWGPQPESQRPAMVRGVVGRLGVGGVGS